ncbi:hypothetical protein EV1_038395 [Malus domestica]
MLPTGVLQPVSFTELVEIYRYYRSGLQSEFLEGVAVPLNPINNNRVDDQSGHPPSIPSPAPSDLDPEILELIRTLDPAVIEWIRNPDPAFLDEIRKSRELSLKEKEDKEGKERETQEETKKERESEKSEKSESGSGGGGNGNGGEVVKEVVEESSTSKRSRRRKNKLMKVSKDKAMQGEELAEKQDQTESKEIIVGDFVLEVSNDKAKPREGLAEKQDQTENKKVSKDKAKQREELVEKQVQTESKKKVTKDKAKQREELAVKQDQTESKKVSKEKAKQREEFAEKQDQTKIKVSKDKAKQTEKLAEKQDQTESKMKVSKDKAKQREELAEKQDQTESKKKVSKDKAKQRGELAEKQGQTKNKYCPGQCKGEPSVAPALELNFLGLPIRPGKADCLHYMQTGTCKYENNCLFNHPDPTPLEESRPQSTYESHGIHSETAEWNDVITPAPAYIPEGSMPARPPYMMNNSVTETNVYKQYPHQNQVEEFPARPGQPDCSYFSRTGDCKFKSNCKYHHPKTQTAVAPHSHSVTKACR